MADVIAQCCKGRPISTHRQLADEASPKIADSRVSVHPAKWQLQRLEEFCC